MAMYSAFRPLSGDQGSVEGDYHPFFNPNPQASSSRTLVDGSQLDNVSMHQGPRSASLPAPAASNEHAQALPPVPPVTSALAISTHPPQPPKSAQRRSVELNGSTSELTEDERVREATLEILPLIMANPPNLPTSMKSHELNQRHYLLSISPLDIEEYLVTDGPTTDPNTAARVMKNLTVLKGHVEQLAGKLATDADALQRIVSSIKWFSPEKGQLIACVDLADDREGLLSLVLKRESTQQGKTSWKFHNVLPIGDAPGQWQSSPENAIAARNLGSSSTDWPSSLRRGSESAASTYTVQTNASFNTADEDFDDRLTPKMAQVAANQEGERKVDDAKANHFTQADDFWGGWSEDEDDTANKDDLAGGGKNSLTNGEQDKEDEDAYWSQYDARDPGAELQQREQEAAGRPREMNLGSIRQMGFLENLENLGVPRHGLGRFDMDASTSSRYNDEMEADAFPDYPGVQSNHERLQTRADWARDAPPSSRSDLSGYDGTESMDQITYDRTTVAATSMDDSRTSKPSTATRYGDKRPHPDGLRSALADGAGDREALSPREDRDEDALSKDILTPTRARTGHLSGEDMARNLAVRSPSPPVSVGGQSTYATPADMSLADLEALCRSRDAQRQAEARARLRRLAREDGRRSGSYSSNAADGSDSDVDWATNEARSTLEDVTPDYNGLPGLGLTPEALQKKKPSPPRTPPSPASAPMGINGRLAAGVSPDLSNQSSRLIPPGSSQPFKDRQQGVRGQTSSAAACSPEMVRVVARRNEHVRSMMKSMISLVNDGGDATMTEDMFLQLAGESYREWSLERRKGLSMGEGAADPLSPGDYDVDYDDENDITSYRTYPDFVQEEEC